MTRQTISTCPSVLPALVRRLQHLDRVTNGKIKYIPLETLQTSIDQNLDCNFILSGGWDGFYHVVLGKARGRVFYNITESLGELESAIEGMIAPNECKAGAKLYRLGFLMQLQSEGKITLLANSSSVITALKNSVQFFPDQISMECEASPGVEKIPNSAALFGDYAPHRRLLIQLVAAKHCGCEIYVGDNFPPTYGDFAKATGCSLHSVAAPLTSAERAKFLPSMQVHLAFHPFRGVDYAVVDSLKHGVAPILSSASFLAGRSMDFDELCVVKDDAVIGDVSLRILYLIKQPDAAAEMHREGMAILDSFADQNRVELNEALARLDLA